VAIVAIPLAFDIANTWSANDGNSRLNRFIKTGVTVLNTGILVLTGIAAATLMVSGIGWAIVGASLLYASYLATDDIKSTVYEELIYDSSGNMVIDPRDIGTYNYSPSGTFLGSIGHMAVDVVPWVLWGNSEDDDTIIFERAASFFEI